MSIKFLTKINKFKLDLVLVLILVGCLYLAWGGVLNQTIEGEGYYYFSPTLSLILPSGNVAKLLFNYDNFPKISYYILEHLFKGNIQPYMDVWFITIVLITISVYLFVRWISKNQFTAFLASLFMGIYYTGDFQFYARGHFQWFNQRVPELIPILLSVAFLYHFIEKKKIKFYLLSVCFFIVALFMTDYTTLFLPLFVGFIASSAIFKRKQLKQKLILLCFAIPYLVINYINANNSPLGLSIIRPHQTLFQSILENSDVPIKISRQLVVTTVPFYILRLISQLSHIGYPNLILYLIFPVYFLYGIIFFILSKRKVPHYHLLVGLFLGLIGVLYLNVYLRRVNVYNEIEQGRYYFIPGLYIAIIFGSFFTQLLNPLPKLSKNKRKVFMIVTISLLWVLFNIPLIREKISVSQYVYVGGRNLMAKLNSVKNNLPSNSIVMVPNPMMPLGEDFLKKYYNNPDKSIKFLFIDTKWKEKIPDGFDINKLFVYDYNDEFKRGGKADLTRIYVEDFSQKYRDEFKAKMSIDKTTPIN